MTGKQSWVSSILTWSERERERERCIYAAYTYLIYICLHIMIVATSWHKRFPDIWVLSLFVTTFGNLDDFRLPENYSETSWETSSLPLLEAAAHGSTVILDPLIRGVTFHVLTWTTGYHRAAKRNGNLMWFDGVRMAMSCHVNESSGQKI